MQTPAEWTDDLVAYLDGELDSEAKRRIEALLASDPNARDELARLQRSWSLLDSLPSASLADGFARNTLAMAAISAEHDVQASQAWRRFCRRRTWLLATATVVFAAAAGYAGVDRLWPDRNAALTRDLALLWHLDEYLYAGDVDFARRLATAELFGDAATAGGQPTASKGAAMTNGEAPNDLHALPPVDADKPFDASNLSNEQQHELLRRFERFESLSEPDRERLRKLHASLAADANSDNLHRSLERYREWLLTLSLARRTEILDLDPPARATRIAAELQRITLQTPVLTENDRQIFVELLLARFDAMLKGASEPIQKRGEKMGKENRELLALQFAAGRAPLPARLGFLPENPMTIVDKLSPELQRAWQAAPAGRSPPGGQPLAGEPRRPGPSRRELLANWIRAAARQELAHRGASIGWSNGIGAPGSRTKGVRGKGTGPQPLSAEVREWARLLRREFAAPKGDSPKGDAPKGDSPKGDSKARRLNSKNAAPKS